MDEMPTDLPAAAQARALFDRAYAAIRQGKPREAQAGYSRILELPAQRIG